MKRAWYILATAFLLGGFAPNAEALLINIEAVWDANAVGYSNLREGSIVQVVVYNSQAGGEYPGSKTEPGENFQPYGSSFLPDTTHASGNVIIATGTIHEEDGNWVFLTSIEVGNLYDKVYLRVFSATNWVQGATNNSYWGISDANTLSDDGAGMGFTWWNNVTVTNYSPFEVIPEPGTMALLGVGTAGLVGWLRRRKGTKRNQTGETGAEEP